MEEPSLLPPWKYLQIPALTPQWFDLRTFFGPFDTIRNSHAGICIEVRYYLEVLLGCLWSAVSVYLP